MVSLMAVIGACTLGWMIRNRLREREQEKLEAELADRRHETKVRFREELLSKQSAEAVYRETGLIIPVRVRSIACDGRGVEILMERLVAPGPRPVGSASAQDASFSVSATWEYMSASAESWCASPYPGWTLIFDPSMVQECKAVNAAMRDATYEERFAALRKCVDGRTRAALAS